MKEFKPKDFVAVLIILVMAVFKLTGHDGTLDTAVALIIGYYFAKRDHTPLVVDKTTATEIMTKRDA